LILDAGDTFFASPVLVAGNVDADKKQAEGLLTGYETVGCDVLNVGGFDLAAGLDFLLSLKEMTSIPFISSNLTYENGELIFPSHHILEQNGFFIGVVGVSNNVPEHIKDVKKLPYAETAKIIINEIKSQVDFVVLLANVKRNNARTIADDIPNADYIFLSRDTQRTRPGTKQSDNGPYVYGSGNQGKYLTVVEIDINDPGQPIIDISTMKFKIPSMNKRIERLQSKEPDKSLEEIYADKPNVLKLVANYKQQLSKFETIMKDAVNTTIYESIPLGKNVGENNEVLAFVDETLASCNALRQKKINASEKIKKK
jgi:2',3'-cyclic-nucleotide 2'-phosphodiesterase (5'-nucleotidase family)